jgi:hypothetical protein
MSNPYTIDTLKAFVGQQETQRLEFKSSRGLINDNAQKRGKFIADQIVPTVSAFLNTDGGQLVIGIEEKGGVAVGLSEGVPHILQSQDRLQSAICDRIQPAVASYVTVNSVQVRQTVDGDRLLAFVVDVKAGTTAYQADDKKYYVRRSGQSEAMEDKDIRLRMLAGDKPRLSIDLRSYIVPGLGDFSSFVQHVGWSLCFENVGIRNIPRAIVHSKLDLRGLSDISSQAIAGATDFRQTDFPFEGLGSAGLLPRRRFELPLFTVRQTAFVDCSDHAAVSMLADVLVYIDDGLPAELGNYNLMADLKPVIENGWRIAAE